MFYVNCLWYVLDSMELEWFGVEKIGFPLFYMTFNMDTYTYYNIYILYTQ